MAHRKLTLEEQLRGVEAALRSKRTPGQLRQGLRKRADWLAKRIKKVRPKAKRRVYFLVLR